MRWKFGKCGRVVSREGGMNLRTKFILIAPGKGNVSRNPLHGFNNRFIMF